MKWVVWLKGIAASVELPPGVACHYSGTAEVDRDYPAPPYGAEPLQIWLPQPPHKFTQEVSTQLLPERAAPGLPFDDKFERRLRHGSIKVRFMTDARTQNKKKSERRQT